MQKNSRHFWDVRPAKVDGFSGEEKQFSQAGTAAQIARSCARYAASEPLFGADGGGVRGLARKGCSHALKISRFSLMHYVLRSITDDGFYIGYSANLRKRFKQHLQGDSFATAYRGPWKLIYYEAYVEQSDALGREKYLKSGSGRRFLRSQLKNYLRKHPSRETA